MVDGDQRRRRQVRGQRNAAEYSSLPAADESPALQPAFLPSYPGYWSCVFHPFPAQPTFLFGRPCSSSASTALMLGRHFSVLVAFSLSMYAQWGCCDYVSIPDGSSPGGWFDDGVGGTVFHVSIPPKTVGIHCWQTEGGNIYDYGSDFDNAMRTIHILSYASLVLMWGVFFFFLVAWCRIPPPVWLLSGFLLAATAVTEGLVLQLMFHSDFCSEGCAWGAGAKCAVGAMTSWTLCSLMTCATSFLRVAKGRESVSEE